MIRERHLLILCLAHPGIAHSSPHHWSYLISLYPLPFVATGPATILEANIRDYAGGACLKLTQIGNHNNSTRGLQIPCLLPFVLKGRDGQTSYSQCRKPSWPQAARDPLSTQQDFGKRKMPDQKMEHARSIRQKPRQGIVPGSMATLRHAHRQLRPFEKRVRLLTPPPENRSRPTNQAAVLWEFRRRILARLGTR